MQSFVFYTLSATLHYPDDKYNDEFATCVAEVSNNLFSPQEVLVVLLPIVTPRPYLDINDTCYRYINFPSTDNPYCSPGKLLLPLLHYIENYCPPEREYTSIRPCKTIHDLVLSKLHKFGKWPIVLHPVHNYYDDFYGANGAYILIFDFEKNTLNEIKEQIHHAQHYIIDHSINGRYKVVIVISGDIPFGFDSANFGNILDPREETIVTVTRKSFRERVAVELHVYEYIPYMMKVNVLRTFCTKVGNYGKFEGGPNQDIFNTSDKILLEFTFCIKPGFTEPNTYN